MKTPQTQEQVIDLMTLSLAQYLNGSTHAVAHEHSPELISRLELDRRYPSSRLVGRCGVFASNREASAWAQLQLQLYIDSGATF